MCKTAGAENFYLSIKNAMGSERMSEEHKQLCSVRTMVVIYIMLYSQSQKCNAFQVALSRTHSKKRCVNLTHLFVKILTHLKVGFKTRLKVCLTHPKLGFTTHLKVCLTHVKEC